MKTFMKQSFELLGLEFLTQSAGAGLLIPLHVPCSYSQIPGGHPMCQGQAILCCTVYLTDHCSIFFLRQGIMRPEYAYS